MRCLIFFTILLINGPVMNASAADQIDGTFKGIEKQLNEINQTQLGYVEKARDFLDLIDKPEKRQQTYKQLEKAFKKDLLSFEWAKSLLSYVLKLCAMYLFYLLIRRLVLRLINYHMEFLANKRQRSLIPSKAKISRAIIEETISPLFKKIAVWVVRIITGMIVLDILHINILPLLFSFSFIGIAITFASQSMMKDLINGIMTLMQGTMAVGEVVKLGESKGVIEEISLRSIVLRLSRGEIEVVPFSSINKIVNYSRDYSISRSDVIISFKEDVARVQQCFQTALARLLAEPEFANKVSKELRFYGITEFSDFGYRVVGSIKTTPDPYGGIGYHFNMFVQDEMRKNNIQFPSPEIYSQTA